MPLRAGTSNTIVGENIRELHGGKTFRHTMRKFGKHKANMQAIAIAMAQKRKTILGK